MNQEELAKFNNNEFDNNDRYDKKSFQKKQIVNYLRELIFNNGLNETDDTFDRDVRLFEKHFNKENFVETTSKKNNQIKTVFKLKDSNNLTIEFEKLTYKGMFYNYSIKLYSSIIPNNTLDIIEEINVSKNKNNLDMCTKIIEQYLNEISYTASIEDYGELKVNLDKNKYLRFYGKYNSSRQGYKYTHHIYLATKNEKNLFVEQEITKEQAINLYSNDFNFADRLSSFIDDIYSFDLNKNIDMILKTSTNEEFDGQDILTLMAENNVKNDKLIEKAIANMLDKEGFLVETIPNLELFLCRENNKESKLIPIVETVRQKIIETEYPNGLKYLNLFLSNPKGKYSNGCLQYQNEIKSQYFAEDRISSFLEKGLPIQNEFVRKITDNEISAIENLESSFNDHIRDIDFIDKIKNKPSYNIDDEKQLRAYQFVSGYKITNEISKVYFSIINQLDLLINNEFFCDEMKKIDSNKLEIMQRNINKFNNLQEKHEKTIDFILGKEILLDSYDFFKLFKKIRTAHTTSKYEERKQAIDNQIEKNKKQIDKLKDSIGVFTFGKKKQNIESEINQLNNQINTLEKEQENLDNTFNKLMYKPRYTQNEVILKYFKYDDYLTTYHPICCYLGKEEIEEFLKNTEKYLSRVFMEIPVLILKNTPFSELDYRLDIIKNEDDNTFELKLFNKLTEEYENIEVNHNFYKIYSNFNKNIFKDIDLIGPALNTIYSTGKNSENPYNKCVEGITNNHYYDIEHVFNV